MSQEKRYDKDDAAWGRAGEDHLELFLTSNGYESRKFPDQEHKHLGVDFWMEGRGEGFYCDVERPKPTRWSEGEWPQQHDPVHVLGRKNRIPERYEHFDIKVRHDGKLAIVSFASSRSKINPIFGPPRYELVETEECPRGEDMYLVPLAECLVLRLDQPLMMNFKEMNAWRCELRTHSGLTPGERAAGLGVGKGKGLPHGVGQELFDTLLARALANSVPGTTCGDDRHHDPVYWVKSTPHPGLAALALRNCLHCPVCDDVRRYTAADGSRVNVYRRLQCDIDRRDRKVILRQKELILL